MKKIRFRVWFLVFALGMLAAQPVVHADAATQKSQISAPRVSVPATPAATQTPAVSLPALPLAPLATQLGQTLQTLVAPKPAQTPNTAADTNDDTVSQVTDTFAESIFNTVTQTINALKDNSAKLDAVLSAPADFMNWFGAQKTDTRRQAMWNDIGSNMPIIVGIPLLGCIAISLLFMPLRMNLRRNQPSTLPSRVGLLFSLFALRVIPVIIAVGVSLILLDQNETHNVPRYVMLNVVYALSLGYTIQQVLRSVFAPTAEHLRPFEFPTHRAIYVYHWLSAFCLVFVYGYFLIDIAHDIRMPDNIIVVLQNIVVLILTCMTITVILQTRPFIAAIMRGEEAGDENSQSFLHALRVWIARQWHRVIVAYLVIGLLISLLGINHGIELMLRGTILTFVILAATRFGLIALDRWKTPQLNQQPLTHRILLAFLLRPALWIAAGAMIAASWGYRFGGLLQTPPGQRLTATILSIAITLFILTVIYEILNASIDRHVNRRDKVTKQFVATARARTLLPMLRNTIFIFFSAIAILVCLSAVGVNIGPLLAGAGVVGVAIGFGSQSLVKDFLTGLFIVAENTVAVGDIVSINSLGGVVETLSIRTIRLRDVDGSLHILPFSDVSRITNMSKGFAYAVVDVGVAYDSDMEKVMNVLRDIGTQIQNDPVFKRVILEPIEVMGIEKFNDSSITVRARIRTRPGKQWDVKRLLMLRIVQRFATEQIELPFPTVTHVTKEPVTGT